MTDTTSPPDDIFRERNDDGLDVGRTRRRTPPRRLPAEPSARRRRATAGTQPTGSAPPVTPTSPPPATRRPRARRSLWSVVVGIAVLAGLVLYSVNQLGDDGSPTAGVGLVLMPVLLGVVALIVRKAGTEETSFDLRGIVLLGFVLRAIGAYLRFTNPVDAGVYQSVGEQLAANIRSGDLYPPTGREIPGTGWIRLMSGYANTITFNSMFANFLLFTFLGFVGAYLAYRAFVIAFPNGDRHRYALLIFLWPSLLYWPSSLGKEGWMLFGLGVACWGVARAVTGRWTVGITVLVAGLGLLTLVRPHVALMVVVGFGVALLAKGSTSAGALRSGGRVVALVLLLFGGMIIAGKTADVLKIDNTGTEGFVTALEDTQQQTQQGGGAFEPAVVRTPLDYPKAFVTVWARPFLWEAHNTESRVTGLETFALVALAAISYRRLLRLPRLLVTERYVTFALTYTLVFVYAFAAIGNFGILARQRTQGLFLLFVLLSLPSVARRGEGDGRLSLARLTRGGRQRRTDPGADASDAEPAVADEPDARPVGAGTIPRRTP